LYRHHENKTVKIIADVEKDKKDFCRNAGCDDKNKKRIKGMEVNNRHGSRKKNQQSG
jgi:hypothetical protein